MFNSCLHCISAMVIYLYSNDMKTNIHNISSLLTIVHNEFSCGSFFYSEEMIRPTSHIK